MDRRRFLGSVGAAVAVSAFGSHTVAGAPGTSENGYDPLGTVDVPGARDAAVHHDGDVAYVAVGDGFAAVDISVPAEPELHAERRDIDTGGNQEFGVVWDVWPSGDRLAVVGPAQQAPDVASGLALFDISDPAAPEQVAWHGTDHHIHNSFFIDDTVYLTGSSLRTNPLVMVDVSDDEPEEAGRWSIVDYEPEWEDVVLSNRVLHDVYVQDDVAYLPYWDAGTWIVDVSDPTDPEVRSRVGDFTLDELKDLEVSAANLQSRIPPGNAHYAQVDEAGEILLVGKEAWEFPDPEGNAEEMVGGPGGVDLWDISDVESPDHLVHIEAPESFDNSQSGWFTTAHNCDIVEDRLYASWYFGGVTVHDISDPANPERLVWWRDPYEASFWTAQSAVPGETFVASSVDISDTFDVPTVTDAALYVFPDEPGVQEDPPDLTEPPEGTPTPTPTPTPAETPTPTPTQQTPAEPTPTPQQGSGTDDDGAGFGPAAAVAGLSGLYALARHRTSETDSNSPG